MRMGMKISQHNIYLHMDIRIDRELTIHVRIFHIRNAHFAFAFVWV